MYLTKKEKFNLNNLILYKQYRFTGYIKGRAVSSYITDNSKNLNQILL